MALNLSGLRQRRTPNTRAPFYFQQEISHTITENSPTIISGGINERP